MLFSSTQKSRRLKGIITVTLFNIHVLQKKKRTSHTTKHKKKKVQYHLFNPFQKNVPKKAPRVVSPYLHLLHPFLIEYSEELETKSTR